MSCMSFEVGFVVSPQSFFLTARASGIPLDQQGLTTLLPNKDSHFPLSSVPLEEAREWVPIEIRERVCPRGVHAQCVGRHLLTTIRCWGTSGNVKEHGCLCVLSVGTKRIDQTTIGCTWVHMALDAPKTVYSNIACSAVGKQRKSKMFKGSLF